MQPWLRLVQLLSLTAWVGGLIFFAFVLAPAAFHVLPIHQAGLIVGATLRVFDVVAMVCGLLFLAATVTLIRRRPSCLLCRIQVIAVSAMLLATALLHWGILPAMETDRQTAGGDIARAAPSDPARIHFDRLHKLSEAVEGGVLVLGVGVVFLLSRESFPHAPSALTEL